MTLTFLLRVPLPTGVVVELTCDVNIAAEILATPYFVALPFHPQEGLGGEQAIKRIHPCSVDTIYLHSSLLPMRIEFGRYGNRCRTTDEKKHLK
jgi:hypothetical protein